jgi:hypothetical protein
MTRRTLPSVQRGPERYRRQPEAHHDAERDLQRAGLLHTHSGPDRPSIAHYVRYRLCYFNIADDR